MRGMVEAVSHLRSLLVTLPLIYVLTIFWGTLSLLVSLVEATGRAQHACARWWARSLLFVSRTRVTLRGVEQITPGRTYVYVANHQSYMDIPVLFAYLPGDFRIMAKTSLFYIPFLGWHLHRSGHMPVTSSNPRSAARSLLKAADYVSKGTSVFIFPEGARSPDGRLGAFKAGTFLLAIKAGVPVVPVTLNGTRAVVKMYSSHIRPGRVEMILHPPISTAGMDSHSADELSARVRAVIAADFDEASAVAVH